MTDGRGELADSIGRRLFIGGLLANAAGAGLVFLYLAYVFPSDDGEDGLTVTVSALLLVGFFVVAAVSAVAHGRRLTRDLRRWAHSSAEPTERERTAVLRLPRAIAQFTALEWALAAVLFTGLDLLGASLLRALETGATVLLGGLVTCTAAWLFVERELRPAVALVLSPAEPPGRGALGIAPRILLTWMLCSGVPLVGLALVPIGRDDTSAQDLVAPLSFIVAVALVAGFLLMTLAMRSVADPVRDLREAFEQVAAGRTDVRVTLDDASEVGRLQAGFNAMVEGLAEREQLRDLFGRQVGLDVARGALERGAQLGGEERTVGALFVDVMGSTGLATRETPERVVGALNAFFGIVVEVAERHGGFVNKFEGDGALCVFGAPNDLDHVAARTLAAARELSGRLAADSPLPAAVGLSCGLAVAGHVGAESRYEYTVIGDPVNEAARLCELAKERPGGVLASAHTVEAADTEEADAWRVDGEASLRGRSEPTRLAVPCAAVGRGVPVAERRPRLGGGEDGARAAT